jgi:hypothetical protein
MQKFRDKLDWWALSKHQSLSEGFILKNLSILSKTTVVIYQKLPEDLFKNCPIKIETAIDFQDLSNKIRSKYGQPLINKRNIKSHKWKLIHRWRMETRGGNMKMEYVFECTECRMKGYNYTEGPSVYRMEDDLSCKENMIKNIIE